MSACIDYFIKNENLNHKITVIVATSGDTGGAVANGFLGIDGVDVVLILRKRLVKFKNYNLQHLEIMFQHLN